jgi:pimeloyl-ACP methyl ester carboxylesterase
MRLKIDNGFLEYDLKGTGIPLLFIHGYPLSRKIWLPQLTSLSDKVKVISLDLRGHGESFPFEGAYSMDLLAEDCKRLLDEIGVQSPILVCGLSMGGYVTMALYQKFPGLFKGMILTSTKPGPDSAEGKANRDIAIKDAYEHGVSYIADNMLQKIVSPLTFSTKPDLLNNIHAIMAITSLQGIVGALQGMKERPDSTPILSLAKCPVLIIHGEDDRLIPVTDAELMHKIIPNSQFVVIPKAGHLPNLEHPDRFNQAIRDFIHFVS